MIGGGTIVFILVILVIIFVIKHNNSKSPDQCEWSSKVWSVCANDTQSRDVTCKNKEGGNCDDAKCTGTKPESIQSCTDIVIHANGFIQLGHLNVHLTLSIHLKQEHQLAKIKK